jgi:hypothetical protein
MIDVSSSHPHYEAVQMANLELRGAIEAAAGGNSGRVRVCARRGVGAYLQSIAPSLGDDVGSNAMANLRYLQSAERLPQEQRDAAGRLSQGARAELAGGAVSADPLADAAAIINYFVRQASGNPTEA